MISEEIQTEEHILEKTRTVESSPCVSIIIPTHKTSPERSLDRIEVKKILDKTKEILRLKYNPNKSKTIIDSLDNLTEQIDFTHSDMGIGLFVSPQYSEMVNFPFEVKEKLCIGNNFEVRDLVYLSDYLTTYYLITINLNEIKLFKGNGKVLKEVADDNFPVRFTDDYEYAKTSLGSSYGYSLKSTEKDKSVVKEIRLLSFLKDMDKKLSRYLTNGTPLIVSGVKKELGYYQKITSHKKNIIGKIIGNYHQNHNGMLGQMAQDEMKKWHLKLQNEALANLENARGKKLAAIGIEEVWNAAQEGKGLLLLVEKDYSKIGFITDNKYKLYVEPTLKKHKLITDSVDAVIELVHAKHGKVMFVENGKLQPYGHIALILRY